MKVLYFLLVTVILISVSVEREAGEDVSITDNSRGTEVKERIIKVQSTIKLLLSVTFTQSEHCTVLFVFNIDLFPQIGGVTLSQEIARDYMFNIVNLLLNYLGVLLTSLLVQIIF